MDLDRRAPVTGTGTRLRSRRGRRWGRARSGVARSCRSRRPELARWRFWARVVPFAVVTVVAIVFLLVTPPGRAVHPQERSGDPFSGIRMFVDPSSPAALAEKSLRRSDPAAAALLRKIASHAAGIWFGGWIPVGQVAAAVHKVMGEAAARDSMPLLVLYAFPYHGCARHATGRLASATAYQRWVGRVAVAIGTAPAAVILEPDALALMARPGCLSPAEQRNRLALIRRAVNQLARLPNTAVYLDAGSSSWRPVTVMTPLLLAAGVRQARGFALNVSNFNATAAQESYGDQLSAMVHGAHYVIDTSRNGAATAKTWCNPPGQALGTAPTTRTGDRLVDALLWVKPPGTSDGPCNGGPPAGAFWMPAALSLAANARW